MQGLFFFRQMLEYGGMTQIIYLTKSLITVVDDQDFERLSSAKWSAKHTGSTKDGGRWYAYGASGYLHRVIMDCPYGQYVDHINGCGLDNRRENLRIVTCAENIHNSAARNKTGFKGVRPTKNGKRFIAYMTQSGKQNYLGTFEKVEDAAAAYNAEAIRVFGDNARLNIVSDGKDG